ncbi:glycosyltransferase family 2 protein [Anaerosolibacter sp.]|uniref:glycosyltransferase family 2 protein n=1 Tax=Anaerosolibacter sp. TaxID=1872527 RepID=UPI0039EFA84F
MGKKVTVQIVTYNSAKDILKCLEGIWEQTYKDIEVIVIDNKSTDHTVDLLQSYKDYIRLTVSNINTGFCGGHNQAFRIGTGEYVLVLNPDVYLDKSFIEIAVNEMENNPEVGSISAKLLRMDENYMPSDIIDSTGIIMPKNRRAYDRGQGEKDIGQYDSKIEIFGVCGAAAFYRRSMLEAIKVDNEYFDENFFAYKEDVDLSWRAKNQGWKCIYLPDALAFHKRGWKDRSRQDIPLFLKVHSIKNRYLMMIKNESLIDYIKNLPSILIFDIGIFSYCLFREQKTLRYIPSTLKVLCDTISKRKKIKKRLNEI